MAAPPHGNYAGPLPDVAYQPFTGEEIVHAQLLILPRKDNEPVTFQVKVVTKKATDVVPYAKEVAASRGMVRIESAPVKSPWDIPISHQGWVLLELDPLVPGWQFYGDGMQSKGDDYSYDFGVRYVMPDGSDPQPGPIPGDGCKVIYFSVGCRKAKPDGHHSTSFLIEFLQAGGGALKVIFDPDIPNNGAKIP